LTDLTVTYDCCGAEYTAPVALRGDELLLSNPALGDTILGMADATHDRDHPECAVTR